MVAGDKVQTNMANRSFQDKESACEFRFRNVCERLGGLWHYCTPGQLNESVNLTPDDYDFSVNNLAISAAEAGVTVLTDSHMVNHLHGLLGCRREQCFAVEEAYLYRLKKHLQAMGRDVYLGDFRCKDPIPITDLAMVRNEIVYIHRNRYVVDPAFTPFSDPWSGASVYFNLRPDEAGSIPAQALTFRVKRALCFRSKPFIPDNYRIRDGRILPSSYLDYRLGESFFRDAQHYFFLLTKNVEAFSEEARRLGDQIVLTEEEMYHTVKQIARINYNVDQASMLPPKAKIEVAKTMHYDYNASNKEIQRILKLDLSLVKELFPSTIKL